MPVRLQFDARRAAAVGVVAALMSCLAQPASAQSLFDQPAANPPAAQASAPRGRIAL